MRKVIINVAVSLDGFIEGADLTATLVNYGLVDKLQLSIHPLLLGQGKPLFENLKDKVELTLTDTKDYSTRLVQLFFRFVGKGIKIPL